MFEWENVSKLYKQKIQMYAEKFCVACKFMYLISRNIISNIAMQTLIYKKWFFIYYNYLVACRFELASSTSGSGDGAGDIFPVVAKLILTLIVQKICICKTKKIVHKITAKHDFNLKKKRFILNF